ncbi:hypothetical protein H2200_001332 [Cladophialophora chaetospira]|uniref:Uncharacterized protein n=1 Tax=Cladophialophora chaetospira TaxID=386627 RepID=A0AA38XKT7_9EURO|nr:hypothetical protein H2200_001332 [Cladophialophora chaetospira]
MASPSVPKTDELAKDIPKVVHEAVAAEVHKILDSIFHTVRKPFENPNKAKYDKVNFLVAERREATLNEYLTEAFDHAARPAKSIQVTDGTGREDDPDGPSTKSIFWTSSVAEGAAPDRVGSSTKDLPPRSPDPTDASWKGKPIKVALIIFESKDKLDAYVADKIDEELPKLLSSIIKHRGLKYKNKSLIFALLGLMRRTSQHPLSK